jgi:four helix bundle protein
MQDFRKLDVWTKAHTLAKSVYQVAGKMRGWQNATLRDQLFRAALSVPTNIVEGRGHKSDREFARFLRIALASAMEVEYLIFFASDIEAITPTDFQALDAQVVKVKRMLTGLIKRLDQTKKA